MATPEEIPVDADAPLAESTGMLPPVSGEAREERIEALDLELERQYAGLKAAVARHGLRLDEEGRPAAREIREAAQAWMAARQEKADLTEAGRERESRIEMNLSIGQMHLKLMKELAHETGTFYGYYGEAVVESHEAAEDLLFEAQGNIEEGKWNELDEDSAYLIKDLTALMEEINGSSLPEMSVGSAESMESVESIRASMEESKRQLIEIVASHDDSLNASPVPAYVREEIKAWEAASAELGRLLDEADLPERNALLALRKAEMLADVALSVHKRNGVAPGFFIREFHAVSGELSLSFMLPPGTDAEESVCDEIEGKWGEFADRVDDIDPSAEAFSEEALEQTKEEKASEELKEMDRMIQECIAAINDAHSVHGTLSLFVKNVGIAQRLVHDLDELIRGSALDKDALAGPSNEWLYLCASLRQVRGGGKPIARSDFPLEKK